MIGRCGPWLAYQGCRHGHAATDAPALEVQGLCVGYPGAGLALDGVSLCVRPGQRVALVGANGAGKSTLLKAVASLMKPAAGTIRVFGLPAGTCRQRTAYLPQRGELDWTFPINVAQLVMTGRMVHLGWFARPGRTDRQQVRLTLERLGLDALAGRQIGELSGGQQQRVLLARTLVQEAELLLLDEPFNAVDAESSATIHQALDDLARQNKTVLIATHDLSRLAERFDAVMHLAGGRLRQFGGGRADATRPVASPGSGRAVLEAAA